MGLQGQQPGPQAVVGLTLEDCVQFFMNTLLGSLALFLPLSGSGEI